LSKRFSSAVKNIQEGVVEFIVHAYSHGDIFLSNESYNRKIITSGNENYFSPINASFETTTKCNEKCLHCYRSCTLNPQEQELDLENTKKLLKTLYNNGIYNIELTGGELLMNNNISEIVKLSCEYFGSVSFLTNGTMITKKFLNILEPYKERISIQIPLESYDEDIHDTFRGLKGSAKRTKRNIKMCSERGFKVRTSTMMTPYNLSTLEETARFAIEELNVQNFGLSSILPLGRGKDYINSWKYTDEELSKFVLDSSNMSRKIQSKFPNHTSKINIEEVRKKDNCGACKDSICINPTGEVRTCVSCNSELMPFGNVLENTWESICNGTTFKKMQDVIWPSEDLESCKDCEFLGFCSRCQIRAIKKNIELFNTSQKICNWAKNNNLESIIIEESEKFMDTTF
jgi:radical SAM protein with 4Fe4S-binding SPASM domain